MILIKIYDFNCAQFYKKMYLEAVNITIQKLFTFKSHCF